VKIELIDSMGDDKRVANAARVSFNKEVEEFSDNEAKLINYLARHGHFTPFTHCVVTLRETVPIFVARQRFKHTVGFTYNEVSRRYVDDAPEFHTPEYWRKRPEGSVKQGSKDEPIDLDLEINVAYNSLLYHAEHLYKEMLDAGVAPEQARMVLPQSLLTSYYVTGSLFAWARAYNLRIDPHAQKEIQFVAQQWNSIIGPIFPHSWNALTSGRN
jgi:thymidylate synthase (FAD)